MWWLLVAIFAGCASEPLTTNEVADLAVAGSDGARSMDIAPTVKDLAAAAVDLAGVDLAQRDDLSQVRDFAAPAGGDMAPTSPSPDLGAPPDMTPRADLETACHQLQSACVQSSGCCEDGVACTYVDGNPMCCQPLGQTCKSLGDCCAPSGVNNLSCYGGTCCALSYITTGCAAGKHKVCAECPAGIVTCSSTCT